MFKTLDKTLSLVARVDRHMVLDIQQNRRSNSEQSRSNLHSSISSTPLEPPVFKTVCQCTDYAICLAAGGNDARKPQSRQRRGVGVVIVHSQGKNSLQGSSPKEN